MGTRLELQTLLEDLMDPNWSNLDTPLSEYDRTLDFDANVYFQPPENIKLKYPCIIYSRNALKIKFANDLPYGNRIGYKLIVIDKNPDSKIPEKVASLPMCSFDRHYTADNLNHDVFNIYY